MRLRRSKHDNGFKRKTNVSCMSRQQLENTVKLYSLKIKMLKKWRKRATEKLTVLLMPKFEPFSTFFRPFLIV